MSCSLSPAIPASLDALRFALRTAEWPLRAGPLLPPDPHNSGVLEGALDLLPGSPTPFWFLPDGEGHDLARRCLSIAKRSPGRSALLVGDAHGTLRWAVCAGVERGAFVWQPARGVPKAGDLEAWRAILHGCAPSVAALRLAAVLERRDVDARFFRDVRQWRDALNAGWRGLPHQPPELTHTLSMLAIARIVFLAFVQRKGWLDQDPKFLARLLLEPGSERLYRDRLRPLWFDALNRAPDERASGPRFAGVPFLNGGLFEPSEIERQFPELDLEDDALRVGFETVIEGYRFVEDERRLDGAAIDPIMLGKVFEGLMADEQRGQTGTFYTPPALVDDVARRTLTAWLAGRTSPEIANAVDGRGYLEPADVVAAKHALATVRVLDPAVGSGAFLLGALEWLVRARLRLEAPEPEDAPRVAAELRRDVIGRSLFGIDVSPIAVLICELRLWLSLAASLPDRSVPPPLPNLHHRIRVGNALHGTPNAHESADLQDARAALRECCDALANATGAHKRDLDRQRRALEREIAAAVLEAALEREVGRGTSAEITPLFPAIVEPKPAANASPIESARRVAELEGLLVATLSEQWSPVFDATIQFPDAANGFDVVVGNPPWVRMAALPSFERERLRRRYRWMQASGQRGFGSQPDLAVAFVERAVELLGTGGVLGLVVPNKLFTAQYGARMRRGLTRDLTLVEIDDLHARGEQPFGVQVYPGVLIAKNAPASKTARVRIRAARTFEAPAGQLATGTDPGGAWPLVPRTELERARAWTASHPALCDRFEVRMGVKTGANRVFIDPPSGVRPVLPMARGRDLRAWQVRPSGELWFAHSLDSGAPRSVVDAASAAYAEAHASTLRRRTDLRPGDPLWAVFRTSPASLGHRVAWRDIGTTLEAAYLPPVSEGGPVVLNTVYLLDAGSEAVGVTLAAWLNTAPIRWLAELSSEPALNGFRRFQARNVGALPVPESVIDAQGTPTPRWLALGIAAQRAGGSGPPPRALVEQLDAEASAALSVAGETPWLRWQ